MATEASPSLPLALSSLPAGPCPPRPSCLGEINSIQQFNHSNPADRSCGAGRKGGKEGGSTRGEHGSKESERANERTKEEAEEGGRKHAKKRGSARQVGTREQEGWKEGLMEGASDWRVGASEALSTSTLALSPSLSLSHVLSPSPLLSHFLQRSSCSKSHGMHSLPSERRSEGSSQVWERGSEEARGRRSKGRGDGDEGTREHSVCPSCEILAATISSSFMTSSSQSRGCWRADCHSPHSRLRRCGRTIVSQLGTDPGTPRQPRVRGSWEN